MEETKELIVEETMDGAATAVEEVSKTGLSKGGKILVAVTVVGGLYFVGKKIYNKVKKSKQPVEQPEQPTEGAEDKVEG